MAPIPLNVSTIDGANVANSIARRLAATHALAAQTAGLSRRMAGLTVSVASRTARSLRSAA